MGTRLGKRKSAARIGYATEVRSGVLLGKALAFAEDLGYLIEGGGNGWGFGLGVEAGGQGFEEVAVVLKCLEEMVVGWGRFPNIAVGGVQSGQPVLEEGCVEIRT